MYSCKVRTGFSRYSGKTNEMCVLSFIVLRVNRSELLDADCMLFRYLTEMLVFFSLLHDFQAGFYAMQSIHSFDDE